MNGRRLRNFLSKQPRYNSISIFVTALMVFQVGVLAQSSSNALSREKIVALKNAGVSDSVLIQQIEKDGISFDMNVDTTLELKNAGFSNDVLQTLLQVSSKVPSASVESTQNNSVAALYKAGMFPELADRLKSTLKANPSDYKAQTLLIMTLLKMKEKDAAHAEFQQLAANNQDPAAAPFVKQVTALFETLDKTEVAKARLIEALKNYRVSEASEIMDQLSVSHTQKEILKINLDVYEGNFEEARDRFSKIKFASYSDKDRSSKILDHIADAEAAYKKVMARIDLYLHSQWTAAMCGFPLSSMAQRDKRLAEFASLSPQEYVASVNTLITVVPLNDEARDLTFHAELLNGNYDQLERLGDQLLKVRGNIRIPFYANGQLFRVVIDTHRAHIYTEDDPHPFTNSPSAYDAAWKGKYWAELVPFDLAFDQIRSVSQRGSRYGNFPAVMSTIMQKHSYALKFEPNGVAPNYALMNIMYCSAGEKAELTVTRNLGQYVLHVIGANNTVRADLANPDKVSGASSGWVPGLMMAGAAMSSNPALSAGVVQAAQGIQAVQGQGIAYDQAQQAASNSFTTEETFHVLEMDTFTGLEELLGVLN